ncbi:MAG: hypothetical protein COB23_05035 [Methylophaga sp.]|nr:MAG: hypothetical protein COB23_05035 [Methylophaga sp.]
MDRAQAIDQFQTLNHVRIARLSELFPVKNHAFLKILPLLLHTNSVALLGYTGEDTPAGIVDYQPANATIDAIKKLDHTFQYKRHSLHQYPIQGLYLINQNGILNFQADTQFELWLVYTEPLSETLIKQLQQKIITICEWAQSLGIKLNPRLLGHDSLINTLNAFELDRFYHSGLVLAGCVPSWWHTTPDEDVSQTFSIVDLRQVSASSMLDFGAISSIEAQTVFDITALDLDSAMNNGLEAGLTLVHLNHQLKQFPAIPWLSPNLKQAIYNGVTDPLLLDPNTLKLQIISTTSIEGEFLSLAQQSFYVLCEEHLSKTVSQSRYPWRRDFVAQQLSYWQWHTDLSQKLDQRYQSQYRQSLNEFEQIHEQIALLIHSLFAFAKQHKLHIQSRRIALEKKYKALFETLPDTVQCLPDPFLPIVPEQHLYLYRRHIDDDWYINDIALNTSKQSALYQHNSLIRVLAWAINNQLLASSTHLKVADQTYKITHRLVLELVQQLISSPLGNTHQQQLSTTITTEAEIQHVVLFINLEHQPVRKLSQQGLKLSSLQSDPLNYSNSKQSLVTKIESLIYSQQGQWHHFVHSGMSSPLKILSMILRWQPQQKTIPKASCWCPSEYYGKEIDDRIAGLFNEVATHYNSNPTNGEYLISIDNQLYKLQWQEGSCDYFPLSKNKSLFQYLAQAKLSFIATQVDQSLDSNGLLNMLLAQQTENVISVFLYKQNQYTTVYILNELGGLYRQHVTGLTETTLVSHFQWFFDTINISAEISTIQFFRLEHQQNSAWKISTISLNLLLKKEGYLPVIVEMTSADDNAPCVIHCGPKVFKGLANDNKLFKQVGELVLSLRKTNKPYPLYITQLSFEQNGPYTSHPYIIQKQRLEYLLNKM